MQVIKNILLCFCVFCSISCTRQLDEETKNLLYKDLFDIINEDIKHIACDSILIYKYLVKADTTMHVDTTRTNRALISDLNIDINIGGHPINIIDDFLNKARTKFKSTWPACGIVISDINYFSKNKVYFIVTQFTDSLDISIYRVNYKILDGKPIFQSYELLELT